MLRIRLYCGEEVETPRLPFDPAEAIQERDASFLPTTSGTTMSRHRSKPKPTTFLQRRCQEKTANGNVYEDAPQAIAVAQNIWQTEGAHRGRVAVYRCRACDLYHLGKESVHLRVLVHSYWHTQDIGVKPFLNPPCIGEETPYGICCRITPTEVEVESEE